MSRDRADRAGWIAALAVVCGGVASLIGVGVADAAESAQITIRGVVPPVCSVSVADANTRLDLAGGAESAFVAAVTEQCNAPSGYTVSLVSRNGGELRREGGGAVRYALEYEGAVTSQAGSLVAERAVGARAREHRLAVSLPGQSQLASGQYEDVVTISISAK